MGVLLVGIALSVVMTPSALRAQQAPPSQPPGGYGLTPQNGTVPARDLALAAKSTSADLTWLWVLVVVLVLAMLAAIAAYLFSRRAQV